MMAWISPKTDWALVSTDGSKQYFNITDYSRIIGNIQYISAFATESLHMSIILLAMAALDVTSIPGKDIFNAVERNIEALAAVIYTPPAFKAGRVFLGDGSDKTWLYGDLNRIENETAEIQAFAQAEYDTAPFSGQNNFFCGGLYL